MRRKTAICSCYFILLSQPSRRVVVSAALRTRSDLNSNLTTLGQIFKNAPELLSGVVNALNINMFSGDHVAVYPINDIDLVKRLGDLTAANLDEIFSLVNTDQESTKKNPFPCPTSYRTALSHYIEITALPRTHILRELAEYCTAEEVSIHYY